jgi:hypothetical protein
VHVRTTSKTGSAVFSLASADDQIPLPNQEFFKVHFIISRILQVSGLRERIERAAKEAYFALDCHELKSNGGTDVGALVSRLMLTTVRADSAPNPNESLSASAG